MSSRPVPVGALILVVAALASCTAPPREAGPPAAGAVPRHSPYLNQPTPGLTPERFAPGLVNTPAIELNGVFTPDGAEFFFTRLIDGVDTIHQAILRDGSWSDPRPLYLYPQQAKAVAVDMAVSPDGQELYFLGEHPHPYVTGKPGYDLWVSRRVDGVWTTAEVVPPPISTSASEMYPLVVADGSLYFGSNRADPNGRLYRAQRQADGGFAEPVDVGPPVSSELGLGDAFVAPDESLVIFASKRPGGLGHGDLYISFRQSDGGWTTPVNLGDTINTDETEFCPMISPDGKYFFFSRLYGGTWEEATGGDVFWVDAKILDRFRP